MPTVLVASESHVDLDGVDVIAGTKVIEPKKTIRSISEGAMFKQVRGIELISMTKEKA